jgi:hypothetical protein
MRWAPGRLITGRSWLRARERKIAEGLDVLLRAAPDEDDLEDDGTAGRPGSVA